MCCRCRRADGPHREVRADRAEVSRGRSTGRDRMVAGKGRTLGETEESGLLVLVAFDRSHPADAGQVREETVSSVEHRS